MLLSNDLTLADTFRRRAQDEENVHRTPLEPFTYTRECITHAHYEWTGHYNRRGGLRRPITLPDEDDTDDEMPSLIEVVADLDI